MAAGKKACCTSCCSRKKGEETEEMELPETIRAELERVGGLPALAKKVPGTEELAEKSRVHHALSDPLRLTILYLIRDQPLCVCVIIRFMRLAGSKLSYHLNILKESGLIEGKSHGNWIIYSITGKGKKALKNPAPN